MSLPIDAAMIGEAQNAVLAAEFELRERLAELGIDVDALHDEAASAYRICSSYGVAPELVGYTLFTGGFELGVRCARLAEAAGAS